MFINNSLYGVTHNLVVDAYKSIIKKIMFTHKATWKEEWFEGHSNRDYKVLLFHASIRLALIIRNEIKYNGLTLEAAKTKHNYDIIIKRLWKCDINANAYLESIMDVEFSGVTIEDTEFFISSTGLPSTSI